MRINKFGLLAFTLAISSCFQQPGSVDERILKSEGLSRVDKLCQSLGKPDDFRYVSKDIGGNNHTYAVGYSFKGTSDLSSVRSFYVKWFAANGWEIDQNYSAEGFFAYRKAKQLIFIEQGGSVAANYVIQCEEEH